MVEIEKGVMVYKDGKGWGITYEDEYATEYGWLLIDDAPIHNPEYCKKVTDVLSPRSLEFYKKELEGAELLPTIRTIYTKVIKGV